jgi:hypothetical protein
MLRRLRTAIAAALLATAASAPAQIGVRASTSADTQAQESIVVQGQRRQIAQALKKMIERTDSEQLARFEDEVCPIVIGMPRDWTASLTRIIRDNVVAVGGKVGKPGCKINAAVIFIDQPLELIKAFAEAEPGFFNMTPRQLAEFTAVQRPIASWHVTDMRGRDGEELGSVRSIVDPGSGARLPVDSTAKVTRSTTVGRLASPVREDMLVGFAVIDRQQTPGKSLRQLADLATMHLLLDINQKAGTRDPGSILSLFEPRPEGVSAPLRLSKFDRGALRGFYTQRDNNRSATQQAENIARAIEKGAGEEPAPKPRPQP